MKKEGEKGEISQGVVKGARLLVEGRVRQGVYRLIKEMRRVRLRVRMGDCGEDGWWEERRLIKKILEGVSGDLRRVLGQEYRAMEDGVKLKCW